MKFSVIIPLYNKSDYVARTLASVFAQTYSDYETIVVDDGSTDNSLQVVRQSIEGLDRCRVIQQDNAGVTAARNRGVEMAQGEYVCFLDADDWWEPTFLETMAQLIAECPEAGMYGTGFYLVKNGERRVAPIGVGKKFQRGYINYCKTYARTLCMPITSSSVALPRGLFVESGGFKSGITFGEDFVFWISIALRHKVALANQPLANYYQDLSPKERATRRLHKPENHMLWNLDFLEEEERHNADLKLLLDRLRASGLYRFYLSREYHAQALAQLAKVDWAHVSHSIYQQYHSPLWWQRLRFALLDRAASIKSRLKKINSNSHILT